MVKILFPARANFGRGKDKQKRKKRGLDDAIRTGTKYGAIAGGILGAGVHAHAAHNILKNTNYVQDLNLKRPLGRVGKTVAIGTSGVLGGAYGAAKLGAIGGALGLGAYGAKKLVDKVRGKK